MSEKNELKEENLEQVSGGRYYGVGAHIVCFRGIKWEVLSVNSSGGC